MDRKFRLPNKNRLSLKRKCLMTIILLAIVRLCASIPTPFIDSDYFKAMFESNASLGFLNSMTGNGLSSMSIMALSITPYITASIIMQLMGVIVPKLHQLQKGMEDERKKYKKITLILSAALAIFEGVGMAMGYGGSGLITPYAWYTIMIVVALWTAGSVFCAVIGELISKRFIGNGTSMILAVNILSGYFPDFRTIFERFMSGHDAKVQVLIAIVVAAFIFLLFMFTTLVTSSEKRIPIRYSAKMRGNMEHLGKTYLPIKLCPGTVVPVIFAVSLMTIPAMIESFAGKHWEWIHYLTTNNWFNPNDMKYTIGAALYVFLIIAFSYFYTDMVFNPIEVAQNFKKTGGAIPGIRPGTATVEYLRGQLKYMLLIGAIGMAIIALVPIILSGVFSVDKLAFMGTSIIITAGVIIDTRDRFMAQRRSAQYQNGTGVFG